MKANLFRVGVYIALIGISWIAWTQYKAFKSPLDLKIDEATLQQPNADQVADMIDGAKQSVVSVYTAEIVQYLRYSQATEEDLIREYLGLPSNRTAKVETQRVQQGFGSGVILSQNGYIITNDHVIRNQQGQVADEILVKMHDGAEHRAVVIGRDPSTDLALIKVEQTGLPFAVLADSSKVRVGHKVYAIGNPMGVGMTVTSGIVSAKNRRIGILGKHGHEDFIQTDASINPGNSGGALVDADGRLVGINTAILSKSGNSSGIGFAIPTKLMMEVVNAMKNK